MSLLSDIIQSKKIQNLIKKHSYLKILNKLDDNNNFMNRKTTKSYLKNKQNNDNDDDNDNNDNNDNYDDNIVEEEQELDYSNDNDIKITQIIENESRSMRNNLKNEIISDILFYETSDNFFTRTNKQKKTFNELEFFKSNIDGEKSLFDRINNTQSVIGKHQLSNIIKDVKTDKNELQKRMKIIQYFKENPKTLEETRRKIKEYSKIEGDVLWFFKDITDEVEDMINMMFFKNNYLRFLNENDVFLNLYYNIKFILIPLYGIIAPLLIIVLPYIIVNYFFKIKLPIKVYWNLIKNMYFTAGGSFSFLDKFYQVYKNNLDSKMQNGGNMSIINKIVQFINNCFSLLSKIGITKLIYNLFMIVSYGFNIYGTLNYSYIHLKIIKLFNQKVSKVSKFVIDCQELYSNLKDVVENEDVLNDNNLECLDYKSCQVLKDLNANDFNINHSDLLMNNKGVTLVAFKKIFNNTVPLIKFIKYIGLVDAWTSVATLHQNNSICNKWVIPNFIENNTQPEILLEGFRNIMVDGSSVENDIHIGEKSPNKNLMITGPNASGKSTFLKGVTECILLAQTICLVPCKKMMFTPFSKINTYLNIPDCQGKESLFQAEMERCFKQIQDIKKLKSDEFVFSIMDEIFVSTNYYEGISGAYAVSEKMAKFKNSMCIISTHFPTLSKFCEKKNLYTNYHFTIEEKNVNNIIKIKKTYKIKKGASKQHIALKMLKEKGFDSDIIKDAHKMYNYLIKKQSIENEPEKKKENNKTDSEKENKTINNENLESKTTKTK